MHPQLLATEGMRLCVRAKVYGIHLCVSLPSELQFSHHAFQAVSLLRSFLLQVAHHLCVHACLRFHTLGDARASSHVCTHSLSHGHARTEQSRAVCCVCSSLLELCGCTAFSLISLSATSALLPLCLQRQAGRIHPPSPFCSASEVFTARSATLEEKCCNLKNVQS